MRQEPIESDKKDATVWLDREKLAMNDHVVPSTYNPIKPMNHRGQSPSQATWRSTFEKQPEVHSWLVSNR